MSVLLLIAWITGAAEPPAKPEPLLLCSISSVAVAMELLDPREQKFMFTKLDEFGEDISIVRRRWKELKDAPYVAAAVWLPSRELACEFVFFNRSYHRHLEEKMLVDQINADAIHQAIRRNDVRYSLWDAVRDAQCPYYYVTVRRYALLKLRTMLGDDPLPYCVPLEFFREVER